MVERPEEWGTEGRAVARGCSQHQGCSLDPPLKGIPEIMSGTLQGSQLPF